MRSKLLMLVPVMALLLGACAPATPSSPLASSITGAVGSNSSSSLSSSSSCPTGYFSMAETAALYVTAAVDDGRTYHYIPMGDPVATTGKCDGHFAQLMHGGDTGWVFKDLID